MLKLLLVILLLFAVALVVILTIKNLRRKFFVIPLLHYAKRSLPPMSRTEREALDAGHVSVEGDLFRGEMKWGPFLEKTPVFLSKAEQSFLENEVLQLCALLQNENPSNQELSDTVWTFVKEKGFLGMIIPLNYGGKAFSALAVSNVVSTIAVVSPSAAVSIMVPNSLGPAELLLHYGTESQKDYYLPRLARGEEIPCFALTSTTVGSDASNIPDTGIVCHGEYQGKTVMGIRLTWDKRYITLAPISTLLGLVFQLYDPDHLLGSEEYLGITLCLIQTNHPGVVIGPRHRPMNMPFLNGITRGKDVFIPIEWLIGGSDLAGQGWRMLMECFAIGRGISLPAMATAAAKVSYLSSSAYSVCREQFKVPIANFEGIQEPLATIGGLTYIIEATRTYTANLVSSQLRPSIISAITKYHLTEMGRIVLNHAMDIHGGKAIQVGPRNYLYHLYESLPIMITVEGANILTRNLMIFGQGSVRCHPTVRHEMVAALKPELEGLDDFDKLFLQHSAYTVKNAAKSLFLSLTAGKLSASPKHHRDLKRYFQQLTRLSVAFAFVADVSMIIMGGELKRRESLSSRLGDILSYLYLGSAVLKYHHNQGKPSSELPLVHWSLQYCLAQIHKAFDELFRNFPNRFLARLLRIWIFPWGNPSPPPSVELHEKVAEFMTTPSEFRDRISQIPHGALSSLEKTWRMVLDTKALRGKLLKAIKPNKSKPNNDIFSLINQGVEEKVITPEEAEQLRQVEFSRHEVIKVDEH